MERTGEKNRDLVELGNFQYFALEFCQRVGEIAQQLNADAQEASVSLQDSVSAVTLRRIEDITDKLQRMSGYGQEELQSALVRTRAELEQWQKL